MNAQKCFEAENITFFDTMAADEMFGPHDWNHIPYKLALRVIAAKEELDRRQAEINKAIDRKKKRLLKIKKESDALISRFEFGEKISGTPYFFFYYYVPIKVGAIQDYYQDIRYLVNDFKKGYYADNIAKMVSQYLKTLFSDDELKSFTFCCVPAHNSDATKVRYLNFCKFVSRYSGMKNGFNGIAFQSNDFEKHCGHDVMKEIKFRNDYFSGKKVIVFDDVVTSGNTMWSYINLLSRNGANVIYCISLSKSSTFPGAHPWDEYENKNGK